MALKLCMSLAIVAVASITLLYVSVAAANNEDLENTYQRLCDSFSNTKMPDIVDDLLGKLDKSDDRREALEILQDFHRIESGLCTRERLSELGKSYERLVQIKPNCRHYVNFKRGKLARYCLEYGLSSLGGQLNDQTSQLAKAKEILGRGVVTKGNFLLHLQPKALANYIIDEYNETFCEVLTQKSWLSSHKKGFKLNYDKFIKEPCRVMVNQTEIIKLFVSELVYDRDHPEGTASWLNYREKCEHIINDFDREWKLVYKIVKEKCSDQAKSKQRQLGN